MRSEQEMMALILGVARADERVRAVYMNGSRTNANVPRDIFQDYDIVYVVENTRPFYEDQRWLDVFGPRLYMQRPEEMDRALGKPVDLSLCYGWLIQLADGNRLDLHVVCPRAADVRGDKLCVVLLDKDGLLPAIPPPTDEDYWVKRPGPAEFAACCNEFWWCLNNVAKGLWREETPYVHWMYDTVVHPQLMKLLSWKAGFDTGFSCSVGKAGKYLRAHLPAPLWRRLMNTYLPGDTQGAWQAVFCACGLFHHVAGALARSQGLPYDRAEARASYGFLRHVHTLPRDADGVF